jgi:hypothetical protein
MKKAVAWIRGGPFFASMSVAITADGRGGTC